MVTTYHPRSPPLSSRCGRSHLDGFFNTPLAPYTTCPWAGSPYRHGGDRSARFGCIQGMHVTFKLFAT